MRPWTLRVPTPPSVASVVTFTGLLGLFTLVALLIATGNWVPIIAIAGGFLGLLLLRCGLYASSLVWMVGIPTVFVFPDRYLNAIPGLTSGRLMFGAIVVAMLLGRVFRLAPGVRANRVEGLSIVFLAIALVALVRQLPLVVPIQAKHDISMYLQGYLIPLASFAIARRIDWDRRRCEQLVFLLTCAGVFLAVVAVLQQYFGVTAFNPHHVGIFNHDRASATLGSPHEFGAVISIMILLAFFAALHGTKDPVRAAAYLAACALMIAALILTKTRAPWLGALVAFAYVFLRDRTARPALLFVCIALGVAALALSPLIVQLDLWTERLGAVTPVYNRLAAWSTSLNAIAHNPLLGMGFGELAFERAKADYLSGFGPVAAFWAKDTGVPHNEFVHLGLLTGLPGLLVYVATLVTLSRSLGAIHGGGSDPYVRHLALYGRAIMVVFVVNASLIDFGFSSYFPVLMFFVLGVVFRTGGGVRSAPETRRGAGAFAATGARSPP